MRGSHVYNSLKLRDVEFTITTAVVPAPTEETPSATPSEDGPREQWQRDLLKLADDAWSVVGPTYPAAQQAAAAVPYREGYCDGYTAALSPSPSETHGEGE